MKLRKKLWSLAVFCVVQVNSSWAETLEIYQKKIKENDSCRETIDGLLDSNPIRIQDAQDSFSKVGQIDVLDEEWFSMTIGSNEEEYLKLEGNFIKKGERLLHYKFYLRSVKHDLNETTESTLLLDSDTLTPIHSACSEHPSAARLFYARIR